MTSLGVNEGLRTFSYSVNNLENPTGDPSSFGFYDSAGNRMTVSYIRCEIVYPNDPSHGSHVLARFEPSGLNPTNNMADIVHPTSSFSLAEAMAGNVSGFIGEIVHSLPNTPGIFEWKATNSDLAVGVTVSMFEHIGQGAQGQAATDIEMIITYGNVMPFNERRLDRYDKGV